MAICTCIERWMIEWRRGSGKWDEYEGDGEVINEMGQRRGEEVATVRDLGDLM